MPDSKSPLAVPSRRELIAGALLAFPAFALLREAAWASAEHAGPLPIARWIERQQEIATALMKDEIGGVAWTTEVERLAGEIDLGELGEALKSAQLTDAPLYGNDPAKRYVRFLDESGEPRRLAYGVALFTFQPQNVITPHVHRHMVSAHMVIGGSFRVRNFDRVRDEADGIVVKPTRDYVAEIGQVSTMCSERDNGHWFVPREAGATTFDVIMSGLDSGEDDYEITTIDPLSARDLGDGTLLAPRMSFEASSAKYTAAL